MATRRPWITYRLRLALAAGVAGAAVVCVIGAARSPGALSRFDVTSRVAPAAQKIVFLGTSRVFRIAAAAEGLLPGEVIGNFALGRGNVVSFLAIASQESLHPRFLFLGLDREGFVFRPLWSPEAILRADSLGSRLPRELSEKVRAWRSLRYQLFYRTLSLLDPFQQFIKELDPVKGTDLAWMSAKPLTWRIAGLDPYLEKLSTESEFQLMPYAADVLREYDRLAKAAGARLVPYLTPVWLASHDHAKIADRIAWRDRIREILKAQGLAYLDYFDYFQGETRQTCFKDGMHLSLSGAAAITSRLLADAGLRKSSPAQRECELEWGRSEEYYRRIDPCFRDRVRSCRGVGPLQWRGCLERIRETLALECRTALAAQMR